MKSLNKLHEEFKGTTKVNTSNGSTYKTTDIKVGNIVYAVTVVSGKLNYINILKKNNNPFGNIGKDFSSFDEAQKHYKNANFKVALLKLETGLN